MANKELMSSPLPQSGPKLTDERAVTRPGAFLCYLQAQLMWWKFLKHRMAVVGGIVVIFLYLVAIFGDLLLHIIPIIGRAIPLHLLSYPALSITPAIFICGPSSTE